VSGYRTQSEDTSPEADRLSFDLYRRMSAAEKLGLVAALCRQGDQLALAGLRLRHPGASEAELRHRLAALRLGPELACRVYGSMDE